ncbi:MAG: MAPEG family protein [Pseudomonadota bacterium]
MDSLLTPIFSHIFLCVLLYALLTVARAPSVWGIGRKKDGTNPFQEIERRASANLSNQFEWPLFFYVICVILIVSGNQISSMQVYLAWLFVIGRYLHSYVQVFTANVRLRGLVFTINFVAVLAMWGVHFYL